MTYMKLNFFPLSKGAIRKTILFIHLWLGLILGLYFTIIGITGSVLVFHDNLEPLQTPEIVSVKPPTPSTKLLPLSELMTRVHYAFPNASGQDLTNVTMPDNVGGAYTLNLDVEKPEKMRMITVNPYTGAVMRNVIFVETPFGFIHNLHVSLLLGAAGELANGYGAICLALLLLSGLWLWWPVTLRQLRARLSMKIDKGKNRIVRDLHHVLGIYAVVFLLIITLTGILFIFPKPVEKVTDAIATSSSKPPKVTAPVGAKKLSIDTLLAIAQPVNPEVKISSFNDPSEPNQPFSCYKRSFAPGFFPYTRIFINPYSGKILRVVDDNKGSLDKKIPRFLSMLHFGLWGSFFIKIIYALVGLVPCGLFITGVLMYLRKLRGFKKA